MKFINYPVLYGSWILWLTLCFQMIFNSRRKKSTIGAPGLEYKNSSRQKSFWVMVFSTLTILSLFFLVSRDYRSDDNFFIEKYVYSIAPEQHSVVIGNSEEDSDITLENSQADGSHLRLWILKDSFQVENISQNKKVDINGQYLNRVVLHIDDEIEINGKERIRILKINPQFPLGRTMTIMVKKDRNAAGKVVTISTFLNKSVALLYGHTKTLSPGFNTLTIPGDKPQTIGFISHEIKKTLWGFNPYYLIVFFIVFLFSLLIYFYLKNQFNGALLLFLISSLPFIAGFTSLAFEGILFFIFSPFITLCQIRRRPRWKFPVVLILVAFGFLLFLPSLIYLRGDFTFDEAGENGTSSILIHRNSKYFSLKDIRRSLDYKSEYRIILGYTLYRLQAGQKGIAISPIDAERIRATSPLHKIIGDLKTVKPGKNYIHLKYPHHFDPVDSKFIPKKGSLKIEDQHGNALVIAPRENKNYAFFSQGLLFIIASFWLFWLINGFGFSFSGLRFFRLGILSESNFFIYNSVYFLLTMGYIMFGILGLHNNYFLKNFEKYRSQALPAFMVLFFLLLVFSRYNKLPALFSRFIRQRKFGFPIAIGMVLLFAGFYSPVFFLLALGYLVFIMLFRLRKDLIYEFQNLRNQPVILKKLNEKPITDLNKTVSQRLFFGLGRILYHQGWDYITAADVLLLLSLFFIVLQVFLGGELGVSVAGFFFLPIELAKILLTIYFADWVSRIDRGMKLNVLWIYALVMIPFILLVVFLKDFSPLMVFAFVFFYHIIKIKKSLAFKFILIFCILIVMVLSTVQMGEYRIPFKIMPFNIILTLILLIIFLVIDLRIWIGKYSHQMGALGKIMLPLALIVIFLFFNGMLWLYDVKLPRVLGDRINSWLKPWQDYNLSYQYINSLWLMKESGLLGKPSNTLEIAVNVPLVEQDLSFSLYVGVMGMMGIVFLFITLFLMGMGIYQLAVRFRDGPFQWEVYVLEFLFVIFSAQFIFPALYVVGVLPIMSQPLPFLSYSNNMLLLFCLPFALLTLVLINNMEES